MQSHNFYSFYGHLAILTARNNVKLRKNDYLCALVQRDNTKVADGQCASGHRRGWWTMRKRTKEADGQCASGQRGLMGNVQADKENKI
jgi:hypothetical protein